MINGASVTMSDARTLAARPRPTYGISTDGPIGPIPQVSKHHVAILVVSTNSGGSQHAPGPDARTGDSVLYFVSTYSSVSALDPPSWTLAFGQPLGLVGQGRKDLPY